ncbi:MarR family winged helix-turn-helix transcriptional regulator [Alloyangia pacifica]|uniref:MarR family winged helix-turn-helix transcriptional regulator n=1 Tax=Alloyangia pacifica TaxID=311180 RepID=UPI001CFF38E0|nr:MarR family transcriptional regulator [Alloyangia pacifica]
MSDPVPDRTDQSLIALRRILRATELYERKLAQAAGLSPAQLRVLQILDKKDHGAATPKALATQMGVSQATVTALVDKLVARDMVSRRRSEKDRRQMDVAISVKGRDAVRQSPDALQQKFVKSFEGLLDWEQAQLVASLERVASMLDAHEMDASPVLTIRDIRQEGQ